MNWLDIVIIVYLALSVLGGLAMGMIRTVLSLAGLLVGIFLAGRYYASLGSALPIGDANVANIVAFAIILAAVMLLAALVAFFLRRLIALVMLGWADRLLGAVFGLLVGGLFSAAALAACAHFGIGEGVIQGSGIARFLLALFPAVLVLLPSEFDAVRQFFQ
ncbi:MAG: CvpA family protein [Chloroflexota bacterium]|nr:CvpA family protein [Chloroflexota bacterium]